MSSENDLKSLIKIKTRRLQKLKEQQALKGVNADPELLIEIEDLEAEIEQLKGGRESLEAATKPVSSTTSGYTPQKSARAEQQPIKPRSTNWEKIGAIAGVVSVMIAVVALAISPDLRSLIFSSATSTPASSPSFSYQVRVQTKDTNEGIPNAKITIEVGGQAPLDGYTDSTGLARIFVNSSHAGQPGRLIVEADGYTTYRQEIDITEGTLPKDILLEP